MEAGKEALRPLQTSCLQRTCSHADLQEICKVCGDANDRNQRRSIISTSHTYVLAPVLGIWFCYCYRTKVGVLLSAAPKRQSVGVQNFVKITVFWEPQVLLSRRPGTSARFRLLSSFRPPPGTCRPRHRPGCFRATRFRQHTGQYIRQVGKRAALPYPEFLLVSGVGRSEYPMDFPKFSMLR